MPTRRLKRLDVLLAVLLIAEGKGRTEKGRYRAETVREGAGNKKDHTGGQSSVWGLKKSV